MQGSIITKPVVKSKKLYIWKNTRNTILIDRHLFLCIGSVKTYPVLVISSNSMYFCLHILLIFFFPPGPLLSSPFPHHPNLEFEASIACVRDCKSRRSIVRYMIQNELYGTSAYIINQCVNCVRFIIRNWKCKIWQALTTCLINTFSSP